MESIPQTAERWPTDIVERRDAEMLARLTALESELTPLRALVSDARHPWTLRLWLIIIGGVIATIFAFTLAKPLGWLGVLATIGGAIWAGMKAADFQAVLNGHREQLDERLLADVLMIDYPPLADAPLDIFDEAGLLPHFDTVQRLTGFRHNGRDLIQTHLTRRETYRDSQGRNQTRDVLAFNGLLFSLPFPEADGEARTIISSHTIRRPRGTFERVDRQGKRLKMKTIKTSSLEFNKKHTVKTDDQVLGHAILDPDRVMRIINMEHDLSDLRTFNMPYTMLIMGGRAWIGIEGVHAPKLTHFPEGEALAAKLSKAHEAVSIPSVMAHHLRLPDETHLPPLFEDNSDDPDP